MLAACSCGDNGGSPPAALPELLKGPVHAEEAGALASARRFHPRRSLLHFVRPLHRDPRLTLLREQARSLLLPQVGPRLHFRPCRRTRPPPPARCPRRLRRPALRAVEPVVAPPDLHRHLPPRRRRCARHPARPALAEVLEPPVEVHHRRQARPVLFSIQRCQARGLPSRPCPALGWALLPLLLRSPTPPRRPYQVSRLECLGTARRSRGAPETQDRPRELRRRSMRTVVCLGPKISNHSTLFLSLCHLLHLSLYRFGEGHDVKVAPPDYHPSIEAEELDSALQVARRPERNSLLCTWLHRVRRVWFVMHLAVASE
mmetsp:Transcript_21977/g.47111  ORF Transcript_21977/g.47111 Transcript_21977/m.47111 type:complete len:316 (+) Transcript_21977:1148-2095(+)